MSRWFLGLALAAAVALTPAASRAQCVDFNSVNPTIPGRSEFSFTRLRTLAFPEGSTRLYAIGTARVDGGNPAPIIASFDGTSWTELGPWPFSGQLRDIIAFNDGTGTKLYVSGSFQSGPASWSLAQWTGSAWMGAGGAFRSGTIETMHATTGPNPTLIVGGNIDSLNGVANHGIALLSNGIWSGGYDGPAIDSSRRPLAMVSWPGLDGVLALGNTSSSLNSTESAAVWTWNGSQWAALTSPVRPTQRAEAAIAYDNIRQRVLFMGGLEDGGAEAANTLWAWSAGQWSIVSVAPAQMLGKVSLTMAFDPVRDRLVVFGGRTGSTFSAQTWEFNNATWTQRTPTTAPPARVGASMGFDPVSSRVILFSGQTLTTNNDPETWAWDGTNWNLLANSGPPPTSKRTMALDSIRSRLALVVGSGVGSGRDYEIWHWSGTAWILVAPGAPAEAPPEIAAFDAQRDQWVALGSNAATYVRPGLGGPWTRTPQRGFRSSVRAIMSLDEGAGEQLYVLVNRAGGFSGESSLYHFGPQGATKLEGANFVSDASYPTVVRSGPARGLYADVAGSSIPRGIHRWSGSDWVRVSPRPGLVSADGPQSIDALFETDLGSGPVLGYVGNWKPDARTQYTGALATFDGTSWTHRTYAGDPPARTSTALAHDPVRRCTVMFGGLSSSALGDTWEFDGRTWAARTPANAPAPRFGHAMVFDAARSVTLMIGGTVAGAATGETWTYNGSTWTLVSPTIAGQARTDITATYDSARQRVVAFGGIDEAGTRRNTTFEWDGSSWVVAAAVGPLHVAGQSIAYDPIQGRTVLAGSSLDYYRWDGSAWETRPGGINEPLRAPLVFDERHRRLTTIGANRMIVLYPIGSFGSEPSSVGLSNATGIAATYDTTLSRHIAFGGVGINTPGSPLLAGTWVSNQIVYNSSSSMEEPYTRIQSSLSYATYQSGGVPLLYFLGSPISWPSSVLTSFGKPCAPPNFSSQPASTTAVYGRDLSFSVGVSGTRPLGFRWRRNGVPMDDSPIGAQGTRSSTLTFQNRWSLSDAGVYDCIVTNPLGQVTSQPATLTVDGVTASGPAQVTPILRIPQPVPGYPGTTFNGYSGGLPVDNGEVVFAGVFLDSVGQSTSMIARWRSGVITPVLTEGEQLPDAEVGALADEISPLAVAANGEVLVSSRITGSTNSPQYNQGIWVFAPTGGRMIARRGLEAVGTNAVFSADNTFTPQISVSGLVGYSGLLVGGNAMGGNDQGVWSWSPLSGSRLVARRGQFAPGLSAAFTWIAPIEMGPTDNGIFAAQAGTLHGIFRTTPSGLGIVVDSRAQAPGMPLGTTLGSMIASRPLGDGRFPFRAEAQRPTPSGNPLYWKTNSGITPIILPGQRIPGRAPVEVFRAPTMWTAAEPDRVAFWATLTCASCGNEGLFVSNGAGDISTVLLKSSPPPSGVPSTYPAWQPRKVFSFNSFGHLVFNAEVTGQGVETGIGVFGWTPATGVFTIAAPGTFFEIEPDVFRTVRFASIVGPGGSRATEGLSEALDDSGRVVLGITFTTGESGLYMGTMPQFLTARFPCPIVANPPQNTAIRLGRTLTLSGVVSGSTSFAARWLKDGQPLQDGPRISGSATESLVILNTQSADAGVYTLQASADACPLASADATVRVLCPADLDDGNFEGRPDDAVTIEDLLFFLDRFQAGTLQADVDDGLGSGIPDGGVTIEDLLFFLTRFDIGC